MAGKLTALFEFELHGIGLPRRADLRASSGIGAVLVPGDPPQLSVDIDGMDEATARAEASRVAYKLYERLLLRFGVNVDYSVPPHIVRATFVPEAAQPSPPTTSVSATFTGNATITAAATAVISEGNLDALVHEVEVRLVTPESPTSAELYAAIDMHVVGLEARTKVVRFLVLYSALALAALFRYHDGRQERVDELLLAQNTALPVQPSPRNAQWDETLYTKLRNDLIHAEERGRDPASAMRAIEASVQEFQRDVALVLSHL